MTTDGTIFKIKEGYILLKDLEDWYSNGFVTPNDRIHIYENGGKRMGSYKISALIKIYGSAFPFRRVARPRVHDPLAAETSSDEDDGATTPASSRPESPFEPSYGLNSSGPYGPGPAPPLEPLEPKKTMGGAFGAQKPLEVGPAPRGVGSPISAGSRSPLEPELGPEPEPNSEPKRTMGGAFGAQRPLQVGSRGVGSNPAPGPQSRLEPEFGPRPDPILEPQRAMGGAFGAQGPFLVRPAPRGPIQFGPNTSMGGAFGAQRPLPLPGPVCMVYDNGPNEYLGRPMIPGPISHPNQFMGPPMVPFGPVPQPISAQIPLNPGFEYRDYPLYNVNFEPEGDWITGREVFEEMEKLKSLLPLARWSKREMDFFNYLNRKNYTNVSSVAICRLCNHTPFGGKLFFTHLFNAEHIRRLSLYKIPKKSFEHWKEQIAICQGTVPTVTQRSTVTPDKSTPTVTKNTGARGARIQQIYKRIPLFSSGANNRNPKLEPLQIQKLMDLFSKVDPEKWKKGEDFLSVYYKSVECSMYCEICKDNMPHSTYKFTSHVLSEKHLKGLTCLCLREFNFWINILNLESEAISDKDKIRIITNRNPHPVPLLDYKLEPVLIEKPDRQEKLDELQKMYKNIRNTPSLVEKLSENLNKSEIVKCQETACIACELPRNHFKNPIELVDHVFGNNEHLKFLLQFGFSERAFEWWKKHFEDTKTPTEPTVTHMVATVTMARVRSVTVTPDTVTPTTVTPDSSSSDVSGRVPLLSLPPEGAIRADQKTFILYMRSMVRSLQTSGKEQARKKIIDWKCDYCSSKKTTVRVTSELDAFQHITSQKHMEKMKFGGPIDDLEYWKKWAINISSARQSSEDQKTSEPPSEFQPNKPRAPMLDQMVPNAPYANTKNKIYGYLGTYNRKFQKSPNDKLEKARAMRVDWHCTYCRDPSNPVLIPNMMYAFKHIMSNRHLENMKHIASFDDLTYWKNWARGIFSDDVTEDENRKTPPPEDPKSDSPSDATKAYSNNPRVPMLDETPENESPVSKERFNEILDECSKIFRRGGKSMMISKKFIRPMKCSYCSMPGKPTSPSNEMDAFLHITKGKHREQMNYRASESDLQHWKSWVLKLDAQVKEGTVPPADLTRIGYGDFEDPKPTSSEITKEEKEAEAKRTRDLQYQKIARELRLRAPSAETKVPFGLPCEFCPEEPIMETFHDLMLHVFNGKHYENMDPQDAANLDLDFYEKYLLTMPLVEDVPKDGSDIDIGQEAVEDMGKNSEVTTTAPVNPTPISIINPTPTAPNGTKPNNYCTLPLYRFTGRITKPTDTPCSGPTNQQVEFVTNMKPQSYDTPLYNEPTKCRCCNLNVTNWTRSQLARHAFSVSHLEKLEIFGVKTFEDDFTYWIDWLRKIFVSPPTSELKLRRLGKLKAAPNPGSVTKYFHAFTPEELQWIKNIDEQKLEVYGDRLLRTFAGCIFCNVWLLRPIDVINHYVSSSHLANIKRDRNEITRNYVDGILAYVKACQKNDKKNLAKELAKCIVM